MSVKIITSVVNNPDFIRIQYHTFKKYMKCPYEFIVVNDAKAFPDFTNGGDLTFRDQIMATCKELGLKCINVPNSQQNITGDITNGFGMASPRCALINNFILDYIRKKKDKYLVLDSDMFLIAEFDPNERYADMDCAIVVQQRKNAETGEDICYFLNGVYYFDSTRMKNMELMNWNLFLPYCDVGGMMTQWLTTQVPVGEIPHGSVLRKIQVPIKTHDVYFAHHLWGAQYDESELPEYVKQNHQKLVEFMKNDKRGKFFCELYDDIFFHYRAGCNWVGEGLALHQQQTKEVYEALVTNTT